LTDGWYADAMTFHAYTGRNAARPVPRRAVADEIISAANTLDIALVIFDARGSAISYSAEARRIAGTVAGAIVIAQSVTLAQQASTGCGPLRVGGCAPRASVAAHAGRGQLRVCTITRDLSPMIAVVIEGQFTAEQRQPMSSGLTARQGEVAALISIGKSTKEIASHLRISVHTARHHTEHVFTVLGVRTRAAVGAALRSGER
jgi:DNA-binding CsgD family transcriptional regulator